MKSVFWKAITLAAVNRRHDLRGAGADSGNRTNRGKADG